MNLELLTQPLEISENPGLDTLDPRFSDIATLVQEADFMAAAAEAEKILEESIYDIRIIGYFLYGVFIEQGVGMIGLIFECLNTLLVESWEAIGPVKRREKHTQAGLNWFMKQLFKKLDYEENNKSDAWDRWIEEVSSDDVQLALDAGNQLLQTFESVLEDDAPSLMEGVSKVNGWLESFQHLVYREPEPETELETELEPEPELEEQKKRMTPSIEGSYHLQLLLKKIAAFEQLIEQEKFDRAALIAGDINDIIGDFDPKIYFPKLFARFLLLLALNVGKLVEFEEYRESPEWKTLQELYKVDLESFVAFDTEMDFSADHMTRRNDYEPDEDDEEPQSEDDEESDEEPDGEDEWD